VDHAFVVPRLAKVLVVGLLVLTTGAHWAALQTVAWTTMLAKNLCTQSASEAVAQTFDGKHPCPLCRAIAAAKKSEKKSAALSAASKMEFPLLAECASLLPPTRFEIVPPHGLFADRLASEPPVPPPRLPLV
jgi:hypothetical protein